MVEMIGFNMEKVLAECIKRIGEQDGVEITYKLHRKSEKEGNEKDAS